MPETKYCPNCGTQIDENAYKCPIVVLDNIRRDIFMFLNFI